MSADCTESRLPGHTPAWLVTLVSSVCRLHLQRTLPSQPHFLLRLYSKRPERDRRDPVLFCHLYSLSGNAKKDTCSRSSLVCTFLSVPRPLRKAMWIMLSVALSVCRIQNSESSDGLGLTSCGILAHLCQTLESYLGPMQVQVQGSVV